MQQQQQQFVSIFFVFLLFRFSSLQKIREEKSVIAFEPSDISLTIDEKVSVIVRLLVPDLIPPNISLHFLYDNQSIDSRHHIDQLPNITFTKQPGDDQSRVIEILGRHQGHLVVTAQSDQVNISSTYDFLLIDVARSRLINIFIQLVGWIYFFSWSISFYPQIILNFRRQSVIGLNFDFLALNLIGHSCYSIYNICLYTSHDIQQQYYSKHPHGVLPVLLNDVLFSVHAVIACLITAGQCVFFERGKQRISYLALLIGLVLILFLAISTIIAVADHLSTLTLLYFYSYVKLAITIIKYVPQAWMNYKRKSTEGWSIGNILLDLTGGTLSIVQMFLLSMNYDDWSSIFGSPTKFGLGLFSVLFDFLFIFQHYVLYRTRSSSDVVVAAAADERTPLASSIN